MNVLLIVLVFFALLTIVAIAILGAISKKPSILLLALIAIAIMAPVLLAQAEPADSREYRVIYSKDSDIVVVDDETGKTRRYSLDGIIHEDVSYKIGDYVTVIVTGTGSTVYIAPSDQNVVVPEKDPKK